MPLPPSETHSARPDFLFLGGHPALDFANTLAVDAGEPLEFLIDGGSVIEWLEQAGLACDPGAGYPASLNQESLAQVRALRVAWKSELEGLLRGREVSKSFVTLLNRHLAERTILETLQPQAGGWTLRRIASSRSGEKLVLALLAEQIARFLAEADPSYLRRCANTESCVLYFYDTTKNHRRQWCSAATCGNRHKVAAFRERKARRR